MSIQRLPHPWLGAYWALWTLATIPTAILTALPGGRWYGLFEWTIWFVAFLIAEVGATRLIGGRMRETLSEVVTWAHRTMAYKGLIAPDRGWTAAFTAIILLISVTGALPWFVVATQSDRIIAIVLSAFGAGQTYLVGRWLYDHLILTEQFG